MAEDHLAQATGADRTVRRRQELAAAGRCGGAGTARLAGRGLHPGEAPTLSLARALAPDHAGDPAAMARLLGFNDSDTALAVVSRWRGQFEEAVLVVDQFEELFTLNPPEAQASFIELLRRLVDAADVHLVLAMRDDYLYRCQEFTADRADLRGADAASATDRRRAPKSAKGTGGAAALPVRNRAAGGPDDRRGGG